MIEVALPGSEVADTAVKRRLYAAGGVPEYVIVDPEARDFQWLQLTTDGYEPPSADANGHYRSTTLPGLVCELARL